MQYQYHTSAAMKVHDLTLRPIKLRQLFKVAARPNFHKVEKNAKHVVWSWSECRFQGKGRRK